MRKAACINNQPGYNVVSQNIRNDVDHVGMIHNRHDSGFSPKFAQHGEEEEELNEILFTSLSSTS